jgi:hypothetical protein
MRITAKAGEEQSSTPPEMGPGRSSGPAKRIRALARAIENNDEARIEEAVIRLSRSRRIFSPLAFAVGGLVLLFDGVKLLVTNWRLTLIQVLPAMWIWAAMLDLKIHVLHGKSFHALRGPVAVALVAAVAAVTVASFFLNAVFAFAIARPGRPEIRPAVAQARDHMRAVLVSGTVVGLLLGFSTVVVTRWGRPWFTLSLGVVIGLMMVCYVAVPARLVGAKPTYSRREKLLTTAVGGALGAVVCTPPYLLGRVGVLMLGFRSLLIPGIILLVLGVTLQAGATGAVRAIKLSVKFAAQGRGGAEPA